ncbi:hypothetical protein PGT21_006883 [Puccinia graminis f. sp. tritici]|uniref:HORMA domain-containing protein n=2 Tax=Puccinia graminis f. sp. tritici TaxID=56615 RepID=E3JZ12_PUCGT|nr:uncharacterized protein PGTG_03243 [Puccinia graminis f. sp. tritici CRL 75-36-700-3]EFP77287.2 hypothetical protein PGTG_03243 [Puccinia graminis f. sp. tritici CRL 75-36-700-3]KAA1114388.1 hypothetical protein PGT21_006883 [Puccinia graminis f. sp. tritici]
MPLAKPIRANRRKQHAANARDRVVKLKGDIFQSTTILCEFLYYAFNAILGLREVYPKQDFKWEKRYDIHLPLLIDPDLKSYLTKVTTQLKPWLETKSVTRIVLALVCKETRETVERWQFDIRTTAEQPAGQEAVPQAEPTAADQTPFEPVPRSDHDMQAEALQIFRQIFSSVTFMPALEPDRCLFTILSYVDKSAEVPAGWNQSNPYVISATADQVPIHGLSTSVYKLVPTVTYCANQVEQPEEEDDE